MKRHVVVLLFAIVLITSLADVALGSGGRRRASARAERIEGVITAVASDQVTVRTSHDDRIVNLTSSTVVKLDGAKTNANVLQTGDKVEVHLRKETDGTLTALSIDVENDMDVSGVVKTVSPTSLTITTKDGDATFSLTPDTVVLLHGLRAPTDAITTGVKVEVHWFLGTGDARVARVVEVHTELVETEGTVTAISTDSMTVHPHEGSDVTIAITPDTAVRAGHHEANIGMIAVGSRVEVKSLEKADGSLVAVLINIENANDLTEVKGEVIAVSSDSITVKTRSGDEVTLTVNADTIVRIDDRSAAIGDVKVGDTVEIDATSSGTTLTAVRIKVENEDERFVEIKGSITNIAGSVLTVQTKKGPVTVSLTSTTVFRGGSATDLTTGSVVEITASRSADGSLQALNVEIENGDDDHNDDQLVEIKGTTTAASPTSITVKTRSGDVTVAVDASTAIRMDDKKATAADLKTGQKVEVKAVRNADDTLLAKLIKIEDEDDDD
jgi:hypothetical protein